MSKKNKNDDVLIDECNISESYLVGLFWQYPEFYEMYPDEKINSKETFANRIWGFYFGLGRLMHDKGTRVFDDITVENTIGGTTVKAMGMYEDFGGYETILEIMDEVKGKKDNFDSYYNEVKKYHLLRSLRDLFGEKVVATKDKYDYHKMTKEQIHTYWSDKVNQVSFDGDNHFDVHYLLEGLEDDLERWDLSPDIGLPFFQSPKMTEICQGWAHGHVYMYSGFGGKGKTSQVVNKVIMSCIENKQKLLVMANEQGVDEFKKMLITTIMGTLTKDFVNRQKFIKGGFSPEEKEKLKKAIKQVRDLTEGDNKLIAFSFLEDYNIENVKNAIRHFANRGYTRIIIDTAKPTEDKGSMQRWERFTEDFKEIYKLARPNGGGLNLAIWCNVQLADGSLGKRFLDEHALGESKKIKNEASVLFMGRSVWDDEYEGQQYAITVEKWEKVADEDEFNEEDGTGYTKKPQFKKHEFALEKYDEHGNFNQYYLLFVAKNRRGSDNNTGLDVLVLKANFANNTWYEVGWTKIFRDRNYS